MLGNKTPKDGKLQSKYLASRMESHPEVLGSVQQKGSSLEVRVRRVQYSQSVSKVTEFEVMLEMSFSPRKYVWDK
jgi:hypothetical protein